MNSRERVLRAIKFEYPDKIPVSYGVTAPILREYGQPYRDLARKYPNDFLDVAALPVPERDTAHYRPDGSYYKEHTDEWGSLWVLLQENSSGEVKKPVLDDWGKLRGLKVPPVPNAAPADRKRVKEEVSRQKERWVGWGGGCGSKAGWGRIYPGCPSRLLLRPNSWSGVGMRQIPSVGLT